MTRRMWAWALLLGMIFGVTVAAIAPTRLPETTPTALSAPDGATVVVENQNWSYIRLYASENGNTPYRVGSIETGQRVRIPLRIHPGSDYCFVIIPLGGHEAWTTESIPVVTGDTLYLSIADHLPFSTLVRGVLHP